MMKSAEKIYKEDVMKIYIRSLEEKIIEEKL